MLGINADKPIDLASLTYFRERHLGMQSMTRNTAQPRESTGIHKLDEIIGGGFPRPSIAALIGITGSGTTSFCKSFILSSLINGRKVLVVCADEPPEHYLRHLESVKLFDAQSFLDDQRLVLFDIYDFFTKSIGMRDFSDSGSVDSVPLDKIINEIIEKLAGKEVVPPRNWNMVLDSITALSPFIGVRDIYRAIFTAQDVARRGNHVLLFTAHEGALEGNFTQALRQYVDSVIKLRMRWTKSGLKRDIIIEKVGFTEIRQPILGFEILNDGIDIAEDSPIHE